MAHSVKQQKLEMEPRIDFVRSLDIDVVLKILEGLDDPADIIRASAVSLRWQNFVICSGLCKQLCMKRFPELTSIAYVIEPSHNSEPAIADLSGHSLEYATFQKEHRAYTALLRTLTSFTAKSCIAYPVSASSTDNYPEESVINTLDPRDRILDRDSYWSSKGHDILEVPEILIYALSANFCVITEINITPFQATFHEGSPVYSARFVRFKMGYPRCFNDIDHDFLGAQEDADDKFVWTYTSQTFPMVQENRSQRFKLPEPVLAIGGFLKIELLGRVQKQQSDGKYYICVAHVQAMGCHLSPAFSIEINEPSNAISLKYNAGDLNRTLQNASEASSMAVSYNQLLNLPPLEPILDNVHEQALLAHLQQEILEFEGMYNQLNERDPTDL